MTYGTHQIHRYEPDMDMIELVSLVIYSAMPGEGTTWNRLHEETANEWREVARKVLHALYQNGVLARS